MRFADDERGFVLSGLALLLILPAMLIAGSYLSTVSTGGEITSIQVVSDKVRFTGWDAERVMKDIGKEGVYIDDDLLSSLEDNYLAYTGLTVTLKNAEEDEEGIDVTITVWDPASYATYSKRVSIVIAPTMHVGYITLDTVKPSEDNYRGYAEIQILDRDDDPVSGSTVSVDWSVKKNDQEIVSPSDNIMENMTNGKGIATFWTDNTYKNPDNFTITVANVTKNGWVYDNKSNIENSKTISP